MWVKSPVIQNTDILNLIYLLLCVCDWESLCVCDWNSCYIVSEHQKKYVTYWDERNEVISSNSKK